MCQRYHCLPSRILAEDAGLLQHLNILTLAQGERAPAAPEPPMTPEQNMEALLAGDSTVLRGTP